MIFRIHQPNEAGPSDPPPCAGAYRDPEWPTLWVVDIGSLEELVALAAKVERIVVWKDDGHSPRLGIVEDGRE